MGKISPAPLPSPKGIETPHLMQGALRPQEFSNRTWIRSAIFKQRSHVTDVMAHNATGSSVAIGRMMHVVHLMRPKTV